MANLKVGRPDTTPDAPSHTEGVNEGNAKGNYESQVGMLPDGRRTSESITGVDPKAHGPIDKRMPCLPPP
ncbi:MAG: hypothetical protein QOE38_1358 [Thermoleophilaceae bacterium]|jgi:hypothetical protein|nr:hypothetical protein [Thermoleophilaceae bacterium]